MPDRLGPGRLSTSAEVSNHRLRSAVADNDSVNTPASDTESVPTTPRVNDSSDAACDVNGCPGCGKPVDTTGEFHLLPVCGEACADEVAALRAERDRLLDWCDAVAKSEPDWQAEVERMRPVVEAVRRQIEDEGWECSGCGDCPVCAYHAMAVEHG